MLKDAILKFLKLDGLVNNFTGYVESRIDLIKYELKEDMATAMAKIAVLLLLALLFTFLILFISIAVAFKIGESAGNFMGFTLVAGFYLLLLVLVLLLNKPISNSLEKKLKKIITEE